MYECMCVFFCVFVCVCVCVCVYTHTYIKLKAGFQEGRNEMKARCGVYV